MDCNVGLGSVPVTMRRWLGGGSNKASWPQDTVPKYKFCFHPSLLTCREPCCSEKRGDRMYLPSVRPPPGVCGVAVVDQ